MTSVIIKQCITCNETGHTYLECPKVNFFSLMCGAAGAPILSGPSLEKTRDGLIEIEMKNSNVRETQNGT